VNIIESAKKIKRQIEELKKKGVKVMDGTKESRDLELLIRQKNEIKGDLAVRGKRFEEL
jgi:hypothetical protein